MRRLLSALLWLAVFSSIPASAFAQAAIAGLVRDSTGAILPGVTVEAASPALIEKVRTAVTDGAGLYRLIDLRPGTYSVTFTLPGFNTVKRDGIELSGTFVATLNIDMRVGAVEETITVTGEAPTVDVQRTSREQVLGKDVLDVIPSGRMQNSIAQLITGVNSNMKEVGGAAFGELSPQLTIHGSRAGDSRMNVDGLSPASAEGSGQYSAYMPNMSSAQEVAVNTAGSSAETSTGGLVINLIPRQGGNQFSGTLFAAGSNDALSGSNFTDDLRRRGLATPNSLIRTWDINPGFGGPIAKDRLWFYTAFRWSRNASYVAGGFFNKNEGNPNAWTYEPDLARQTTNGEKFRSANARLTWQASPKNKISVFWDDQTKCNCPNFVPTQSPEFGEKQYGFPMNRFATATWTSTMTNRLLLEAGVGNHAEVWQSSPPSLYDLRLTPVTEQSTGISYRGAPITFRRYFLHQWNMRASATYVTGSHEAKVGMTNLIADKDEWLTPNGTRLAFRFNNGVPNQLTETSAPYMTEANTKYDLGFYAQDRWTIARLTLNLGVRLDMFSSYFPEQALGPSLFTPNRNFTFEETDFINWRDVSPRLGASYDLFGDGKTALKVSLNRYVQGQALSGGFTAANPLTRSSLQITRSWNDATFPVGDARRGNFVPDCDLTSVVANGECGAASDQNFGKLIPSTTIDPDTYRGWGKRQYNWEFSTSVQREIIPRVSADVGFFHRWYGNFLVTDNRAVRAADYSRFSVTAPTDARLPDGGGYSISGLYDLNPDKFGQTDNYLTFAKNYGDRSEKWTGVDVNLRARLAGGAILQGGVSTGRTVIDQCDLYNQLPEVGPLTAHQCHNADAFLTQVKALGAYTVPRIDVQLSATFQSLPGPRISANVVFPSATIAPSLGRPLSGGAANATINVVNPGEMYGERLNQLDLRFGKRLNFGGTRSTVALDVFNATNSNTVLSESAVYTIWRTPQSILTARYARFSLQFDF